MTKKPCIQCGEDCDILPVQLGDVFTLVYLRVCSDKCLFIEAYEYIFHTGYHKSFRNSLFDKQTDDDRVERDAYLDKVHEESVKMSHEILERNKDLLSMPIPKIMNNLCLNMPPSSGSTVRFTRPKIEDRLRWQSEHVETLEKKLKEAKDDLEKLKDGMD